LFQISVYCKLLATQVRLKGYKETQIAGRHTATKTGDWLQ